MENFSLNERQLQNAAHQLLSDPSIVRNTFSNKRLQILSPGRINVGEGPDFLDIAILLQGDVIIGDAEFHFKSSQWLEHKHHTNDNYKSVILHICTEANHPALDSKLETLVIEKHILEKTFLQLQEKSKKEIDLKSLEDLQHYALLRLLRKTSDAKLILTEKGLDEAIKELFCNFINRYNARKRRPVYKKEDLLDIMSQVQEALLLDFLHQLENGEEIPISDRLQCLLKTQIASEGPSFRRELILNCVLPLAMCLANDESRISLFLWFWSTPALSKYGVLTRRFENFPQNFLWQQQGMLEYMKDYGKKTNVISDVIKDYGFTQVLSFYKLGRSPFQDAYDLED
ncbi:MAG: DUF2851 family protein [Ignavibacteria bacterium]|nr:DUF2851 family protein [Ignavibacteria bacterium]